MVLSMNTEGIQVAKYLADRGIAAFVLKYRLRPSPESDQEMQADMARMMAPRPPGGAPGAHWRSARRIVRLLLRHRLRSMMHNKPCAW